jgi:type II secretory pathway pseudopilin PulG
MNLAASASQTRQSHTSQDGYAMAALLVGMAVMAIMLSVAMPTWNQMIRREKEEELVFRGNQYARAINFYQRKFANASPANFDILVEQHMLRKKYKDPMSPDKDGAFQPLYINNSSQSGRLGSAGQTGSGSAGQQGSAGQPGSVGTALGTTPTGGIMGVTSKNKGESLRTYNGKTHYNEWQFIALQTSIQGGAGPQGGRGPGGPGGGRGPAGQGFPGGGQPGGGPQRGGGRGPQRGSGPGGPGGPGSTFVPSRPGVQGSPPSPFQPSQPPSQPGTQPPSRGPR